MKIPNYRRWWCTFRLSLARIVSEDSQPVQAGDALDIKSSKDS